MKQGYRLGELAERVAAEVRGDPDVRIGGVATLEQAGPSDVAFLINDDLTDPNSLILTASSSNTSLLPAANLTLSGTGSNRFLQIIPDAGQTGTSAQTGTKSRAGTQAVIAAIRLSDKPLLLEILAKTGLPRRSNNSTAHLGRQISQTTSPGVRKWPLVITAARSLGDRGCIGFAEFANSLRRTVREIAD